MSVAPPLWFPRLARFGRAVTVAALAGIIAGSLVGGLGSRLAMRIAAIAAGPQAQGLITENGNVVGEITAEGTLGLILFVGAFSGISGGLLYLAVRRWLPERRSGLAFGLLILAVFGSTVVNSGNADFSLLEPPLLNVITFALLFPLFGLVVAPLAQRFETTLPPVSLQGGMRPSGFVYALFASLGLLPPVIAAIGFVAEDRVPLLSAAFLLLYALVLVPKRTPEAKVRSGLSLARISYRLAYLLLSGCAVVGLALDAKSVSEILRLPVAGLGR